MDIDRRTNRYINPVVIPPLPQQMVTRKLNRRAPSKVSKMDQSPDTSVEMFNGAVGNQIGGPMPGDQKQCITPMARIGNFRNPMDSRSTCVLDASSQMEKRKESPLVVKVVLPNTTDPTGEQAQNKRATIPIQRETSDRNRRQKGHECPNVRNSIQSR